MLIPLDEHRETVLEVASIELVQKPLHIIFFLLRLFLASDKP